MLLRSRILHDLQEGLRRHPVVALTGLRQSGKTTLARQVLDPASPRFFDLEEPQTRALFEQPMTALEHLEGLVVLDEIQRAPDPARMIVA